MAPGMKQAPATHLQEEEAGMNTDLASHLNLSPDEIIQHTGDPLSRLEPEDLVLAGILHNTGLMAEGDEKQKTRGRDVLREALRSQTGEKVPANVTPPTLGAGLTPMARELRAPAEECRREHRRFIQMGGWARPENCRILEAANMRYDAARTAALERHGTGGDQG